MFKNINSGLIASRASFLTDRNRLLYTKLIENSTGQQFYSSETGYVYHIFTEPGSFEVHTHGFVDIMLVGGGGGGGGLRGTPSNSYTIGSAGGGAGGVNHRYNYPMPVATYTVTIGQGGSAGPNIADVFNPDSYTNENGHGARGGHTVIEHMKDGPPGSYLTPDLSPYPEVYFFSSPSQGNNPYPGWGTRVVPGGGGGDHLGDYLMVTSSSTTTHCLAAIGGGGGGYSYGRTLPQSIPGTADWTNTNPYGIDGWRGGSRGGASHWHASHTTFTEYWQPSNPLVEYPLRLNQPGSEIPQGNDGGNHGGTMAFNNAKNGAGGGGGAGAAGGNGTNVPGTPEIRGYGGIGVAAFGNDIGIPEDFGTDGPSLDPTAFVDPNNNIGDYNSIWGRTKTRWFGGGGFGGANGYNSFGYGYYVDRLGGSIDCNWAKHGFIGGGAAYFPPAGAPAAYRNNLIQPNVSYLNGQANTGGGGAGGDSFRYYNGSAVVYPAGSGGSGIVIIRYQASH